MRNIDKINEIEFETIEMADFFAAEGSNSSYRLTKSNISAMPDETKDIVRLRMRIGEIFKREMDGNYAQLEVKCDIKRDTFQKVQRSKNGRNVTYNFLAKFCIGTQLSVEEAKELFLLMGHELSERNRCDYILLCELENGGDLMDYNDDMIEYGYGSVISKAD